MKSLYIILYCTRIYRTLLLYIYIHLNFSLRVILYTLSGLAFNVYFYSHNIYYDYIIYIINLNLYSLVKAFIIIILYM